LDTYCKFSSLVDIIFDRNHRALPMPHNGIEAIIVFTFSNNEMLKGYLGDPLDSGRFDQRTRWRKESRDFQRTRDLAEQSLNGGSLDLISSSEALPIPSARWSTHVSANLLDWIWRLRGSWIWEMASVTPLIQTVLISHTLHTRDHFNHQFMTLREAFISVISDRLVNFTIKFLAPTQRRCFAWEDEIPDDN
jgi:hypothetical protein